MSSRKLQIGGAHNQVLVRLDDRGTVWFNRGGIERSDWVALTDFYDGCLPFAFRSIALWGEKRDMLEGLDENGEIWSFDGYLEPTAYRLGDGQHPGLWVRSVEVEQFEGEDQRPDLVELTAGFCGMGRGNELFALDDQDRIWVFDPEQGDEWFQLPLEVSPEVDGDGYDGEYDA